MTLNLPDLTVIVALIAGWFSLLGLLISKEQKISEFRQQWIDALRTEVSSLIAHANTLQAFLSLKPAHDNKAFEISRLDYTGINQAAAQIRMRLNPEEESGKAILATIVEIENLFADGKVPDHQILNSTEKELVRKTSISLKNEWNRVKRGELVFAFTKWISAVVALVAVVAMVYSIWIFLRSLTPA